MISFSDIDYKNREILVALEEKYYKQFSKADKLKDNSLLKKKYLSNLNKAAETKQLINKTLLPLFMKHDDVFKTIAKKNYNIIDNKTINLKTRKIGLANKGYKVSVLSGSINKNGLIYCNVEEISERFFSCRFPSHFTGYINCLGYVYFKVSKTDFSMFKTLPKTFSCKIHNNGEADLHTEKRDYDIRGNEDIIQVIGTIFSNKSEKNSFFENRAKLIDIINDYRELYLKEIKI